MMKLQRSFPGREELARTFLRRLSGRDMEVELPGTRALPAGAAIDLDLRLADGSPLIVGLGEVGGGGEQAGVRRVRFIELDDASRAELPGLVALHDVGTTSRTVAPTPDLRDPDETLQALVEGVFGERSGRPRRPGPDETILVPPAPDAGRARPEPAPPSPTPSPTPAATPAPAAALAGVEAPREARPPAIEPPPAPVATPRTRPPATEREAPKPRRSLLQRLQVSPAVIVASIIAGATGAAANAWFEDLAGILADADPRATEELLAAPVVDLMPAEIKRSRFPEPEPAGSEPAPPDRGTPAAEPPPGATTTARPPTSALPAAPAPNPASADMTASIDPAAPPADRVRLITWDEQAAGTVVTFWGNGEFLPDRITHFRVAGDRPREVVKLRGIDLPFPQTLLDLGTPEVVRVRTGFHPQGPVNELHMVLDLTGPDVVLERVEAAPQKLLLHLSRQAGAK